MKSVHAVVLAAGLSTRMGEPKQLLPFGDGSVLQTVVDVLLQSRLDGVHVILGHRGDEIEASLASRPLTCVLNERYLEGMFTSVLAGLHSVPADADGILLALGDQPQIRLPVVDAVLNAYSRSAKGIVIPTYDGRRGHPIVLDLATYRPKLEAADPAQGLKPIVRGHPGDTLELPVDDPGILRDIDTPEDYAREIKRRNGDGGEPISD